VIGEVRAEVGESEKNEVILMPRLEIGGKENTCACMCVHACVC